jgi:hypothetical protein
MVLVMYCLRIRLPRKSLMQVWMRSRKKEVSRVEVKVGQGVKQVRAG